MKRCIKYSALCLCVIVTISFLVALLYKVAFTTTVPIVTLQRGSPLLFVSPVIAGKHEQMLLDTGAPTGWIRERVITRLIREDSAKHNTHDIQVASSLGGFGHTTRYLRDFGDIFSRQLATDASGGIGNDWWEGTGIADSTFGPQTGVRITIDPILKVLSIDWSPFRRPLTPKSGNIVLPLRQTTGRGEYYVSLALDDGIYHEFLVDTGCADVGIPREHFLRLSKRQAANSAVITLRNGDAVMQGTARPHPSRYILGLSVLLKYRCTIDFRDKLLYLEPP